MEGERERERREGKGAGVEREWGRASKNSHFSFLSSLSTQANAGVTLTYAGYAAANVAAAVWASGLAETKG